MKSPKQFQSIFVRELFAYFNSPIAYIFIVVFILLTCGLFMTNFFLQNKADMRYFFTIMPVVLSVFIPAITMRSWSEDRRGNTFELLLTFPMDSLTLVLGKFLAGYVFFLVTLVATLPLPILIAQAGQPDLGPIIGGYLGTLLMGGFYLSVGIFLSGLCKDQIVSFILATVACFYFYLTGLDFIAGIIDGWAPGIGSFLQHNFGMTQHYQSFVKGILDVGDVIYFMVMVVVFLGLNALSIEDRMRPKAKMFFWVSVMASLGISMLLNSIVLDLASIRFDLTEAKLYTITDSTKKMLKQLKAPVLAKLYISPKDKMPTEFKTLEQDIVAKLEELKTVSGGRFDFHVISMEVLDTAEEDSQEESLEDYVQKKGIQSFQVKTIDKDEVDIKRIYSSIAIAYKEKPEQIIPQVITSKLNRLEYEIMARVFRMTLEKTPMVALVAPFTEKSVDRALLQLMKQMGKEIPEQYREDNYKFLQDALKYEEYEIERIRLTEEEPIPVDTDTLVIVDPSNLDERQRYEINAFLHQGGNVIIAAQEHTFDYRNSPNGVGIFPNKNTLGIDELISNYGIEISDDVLMDNRHEVLNINSRSFGPFATQTPVRAPMHVRVEQDSMNQDVSITSRLSPLFYLWGSPLTIHQDRLDELDLKKTVLFTSGPESWVVDSDDGKLEGQKVLHNGENFGGPYPLAVMLEGQFPNVFEGQDMPDWSNETKMEKNEEQKKMDELKPLLELSPAPGRLLVIGCSRMWQKDFFSQGGMMNLFVNSVDALTLGNELISIRSHQAVMRTLKKLSKTEKLGFRFMTVWMMPILIILIGSGRAWWRQKEKTDYMKSLSEGKK